MIERKSRKLENAIARLDEGPARYRRDTANARIRDGLHKRDKTDRMNGLPAMLREIF
uniref:Uncharacterized protein n=1 Tax=Candidatus Kentrum eta TaxID=2126337 RepID=A0A450UZP4_9GAMM|nr:MAG: hypothetical protein BECKH772A_GA0070896_100186 [Candidatus Kentron sp. H]VFJ90899.1 MAG: hypothetical protein BECKH772B_GA0070898_1001210 [Candidatus Kentron sp. H]VFJ97916.1 MAG: hypothetical protein BECKH772C_GA0070978_100176 [Candidatus Kentron sp. H]